MLLTQQEKNNTQVARWLLIGVAMIIIQIALGGITRLTESGLSITEWKPITGVLPPIGDVAWQAEFDKYKNTDQFRYVHQHFTLSDFKFIFFWEWFHRLWGRFMGLVFVAGFIYFMGKKKFTKDIIAPMVFLFFLGGIQGFIGWVMVKSGLVPEKYFVGHIELTTHFVAAIILLAYVYWFACKLLPSMQVNVQFPKAKNILIVFTILLFLQFIYGGFMAGLRAGMSAPTWPSINGAMLPETMWDKSGLENITGNPIMVHFIHRGVAYLLLIIGLIFYISSGKTSFPKFNIYRRNFLIILMLQVTLGVFTVLFSTNKQALVWLGVMHQLTGMMLLLATTGLMYLLLTKRNAKAVAT